ncbi:MAG TPA: chorismate synthase [Actinomycetota bacterium]|jgi:chorismate synthase
MLRVLTAGESHGPALSVIVEGMPAGLPVSAGKISDELARRRLGFGRGPRMKIERDELEILSGVRFGRSLGSPIGILIRNSEWKKWERVMSQEGEPAGNVLTEPRPGHADLAGMLKYGFSDARNVLERASARETAARCAAGALAKMLLAEAGIHVVSHVVALGKAEARGDMRPTPGDLDRIDASPVRCLDPDAEAAMIAEVEAAGADGDSLGGIFEVIAWGVPTGLGSHVHWDRRLDGRLAQALMSIQAIKGVEVGDGFEVARMRGTEAHDEIFYEDGRLVRHTDRAGGTEGGISIGGTIRVRAAMKPLSTLKRPLRTVDMATGEPAVAFRERTDVCSLPAAGVVGETMVAWVLAGALLEKFGGDTMSDVLAAMAAYQQRLDQGTGGTRGDAPASG